MKESDISRSIQVALSLQGARVFVNTVGFFETKDGRAVHVGLCVGSSDLIGWTRTGRFLAIEVKTEKGLKEFNRPGKKKDQKNFLKQVNKNSGIGFVAASADSAVRQYKEKVC